MSLPPASADGGGWRALAYLADDHGLSATARLVLYELAARIDQSTGIWRPVSLTDWARLLGVNFRTLRAAVDKIEALGWISGHFPRGHDGAVEITVTGRTHLFAHLAPASVQLEAPTSRAVVQLAAPGNGALQLHPVPASDRVPIPAGRTPAIAPGKLPPGTSGPKEGSSLTEELPSLSDVIARRLGDPLARVLTDPSNTGARRQVDRLLGDAAKALDDPGAERVVAKVLEQWPAAAEIRNPAGFLLERARNVAAWAGTPEARLPERAPAETPSPTAYGVAAAAHVLSGRKSAEEARFNCDFAFTTEAARRQALEALDAVLEGSAVTEGGGVRP